MKDLATCDMSGSSSSNDIIETIADKLDSLASQVGKNAIQIL